MTSVWMRQAWRRRRRLIGAAVSIVVGVAFLAGTLTVGSTIEAAYADLFSVAVPHDGVVVRNATSVGELAGRGPIPETVVDRIEGLEGVDTVTATVEGPATIVGADGRRVGADALEASAGTWLGDAGHNPYRLVAGRGPASGGEVVIDRGVADAGGLTVGDRTTLLSPAAHPVTVVGVATYGSADSRGASTFVGLEAASAPRLLGLADGTVTDVLVVAEEGVANDLLARRVQEALPAGVEAVTGDALADEELDAVGATFLDSVRTFLAGFSLVVLVVATISIGNTLSILGAQRAGDTALLRTIGATRRQVLAGALVEAAALGLAAAAAGAALGTGLALLLLRLFDAAGMPLPSDLELRLSPGNLGFAVATGVVVTLVAALRPVLRASRVGPLDARRSAASPVPQASPRRALAGAVLAGLGATAAAVGAAAGSVAGAATGAMVVLVGVGLVVPSLAAAAGRVAERTAGRAVSRRIAARNARRDPRRTAGSATTLAVALAVVALVAVVVASLQQGTGAGLERSLLAPVVLTTGRFDDRGLAPEAVEAVRGDPRVGEVASLGGGRALVDGSSELVTALDPADAEGLVDLGATRGRWTTLSGVEVAVSERAADAAGWDLGDRVTMRFADGGSERLTVGSLYDDPAVVGDYVVSPATWARHGPATARLVLVAPAAGRSDGEALAAVGDATAAYGHPDVFGRSAWIEEQTAMLDRLLGTIFVLLAFGVVISLVTIANAMSLALHERRTEIGLLRLIGQTAAQVRSTVRWECVLVAALGTALGLSAGLLGGWVFVTAAASDSLPFSFVVPLPTLAVTAVVGIGASTLATVRPARRILRLDPLASVRSE